MITERFKKSFMLLLFLMWAESNLFAQKNTAYEYEVKAAFLYNFTRFVEWPKEAFEKQDDPFVIGIIGANPFGNYLNSVIEGEYVGTRKIVVREFKDTSGIKNCNMVFVNSLDIEFLKAVIQSATSKNILTVGESASFPRLGGHIRFFTENRKIRFVVNTNALKKSKLQVSSKLISIAQVY